MMKYPKQATAARKATKGKMKAKPAKKGGLTELGSIKPRKAAKKPYRKKR